MKKVLIVDDAIFTRRLVGMTLAGGEYQILQATDGKEALLLAEREHPHIMLLDVGMPGMDGLEVCQRLKANPATSDIVVIMLTARTTPEDKLDAVEAGADGYITKPFGPAQLKEALARVAR